MNNFSNQVNTISNSTLNAGAVAIEQSRAITEAQGKLLLAKQFPRNDKQAFAKLMDSCSRHSFASQALYSFPRGGQTVAGASIRLAEEIARLYGNIEFGLRELSNNNGESEMEAVAWDLENNVISSQKFKVKHERKARGKMQKLNDTRDIYELTANMGARRLRARLLAILPPDFVEEAVSQCRLTLAGNSDTPMQDRIRSMLTHFSKFGVNQEMIEKRLEHGVDSIDVNELTDLMGIFNSIKNSQSKREEWFEVKKEPVKIEKPQIKQGFNQVKTEKPEQEPQPQPQAENKGEVINDF